MKYELKPDLTFPKLYYIYEDTTEVYKCIAVFYDVELAMEYVAYKNQLYGEVERILKDA
jgi:hypothetical protein